ncbi:hepatitis A virus cellular receptor 1 homolog isoform X4 [Hyla sarda]|uniref:hepatitis A virus cellular receptor 1 homolog isoform X3 n=1 Tax=Hyla sarda TaxID=327740 RepID=UPI0024C422D0|nr:hepatitis A virus cellular receptor 1 homolog isoform X3 [Hyla sarda]XP_056373350.1 hepatitis A virus cellular receptor 1 homolog isoform X4 [Hyla sarda]
MCWGRGWCPWYGCNDEIIKTDGQNVTWRKSGRHQLLGNIRQGDVSLTITGATKEDEGTYCCRVEIPGWFNDLKKEMNVNMNEVLTISEDVTGSMNDTLTLPCTYTPHKDQRSMCWERGDCSQFGCNKEIIKTDGQNVTERKSDRYQLLGDISEGDVSLTITGATKEDKGTYCCHVEIPGQFNDRKKKVEVKIQEENAESTSKIPNSHTHITATRKSMYQTYDVSHNPVTLTTRTTSFTSQVTGNSEHKSQSTSTTSIVIPSIVVTLFLITLIGVIIFLYKYKSGKKTITESTLPVVNLEALEKAGHKTTDNIYT